MAYSIDCRCGTQLPVSIGQCGTSVTCPKCRAENIVPNSVALKKAAGEKYPLLSPIDRIRTCAANREEPFDGRCHGCGTHSVITEVPITLEILMARAYDDDEAVRWGLLLRIPIFVILFSLPLYVLSLLRRRRNETWESISFPLLLCSACLSEFESSRRWGRTRYVLKRFALIPFFAGMWILIRHVSDEGAATLIVVLSICGALVLLMSPRANSRAEYWVKRWLEKIRGVPDVIAGEEEFRLRVGPPRALV